MTNCKFSSNPPLSSFHPHFSPYKPIYLRSGAAAVAAAGRAVRATSGLVVHLRRALAPPRTSSVRCLSTPGRLLPHRIRLVDLLL